MRDHPRACGEHRGHKPIRFQPWGSSPRLRGTPLAQGYGELILGIIPALAGNTAPPPMTPSMSRDHPRACGEHEWLPGGRPPVVGSSPRLRGTLPALMGLHERVGIIPALAGNTWLAIGSGRDCRGSSPRLRGTRFPPPLSLPV